MNKITLLGEDIDYAVKRSNRATIPRIDVDIHGVRVVLPVDSDMKPEALLKQKATSVVKTKREYKAFREKFPDREYAEGEIFLFLGQECIIAVKSGIDDYQVNDREIVLSQEAVNKHGIRHQLEHFYRSEAIRIIGEMLEKHSDWSEEYQDVKLKNQKTRWGSCSPKKNLNFNWRIVMAPEEIVEYVVVHELVHLQEENHTKRFWLKLASVLPDFKVRAEWLSKNSPQLIFSHEDY